MDTAMAMGNIEGNIEPDQADPCPLRQPKGART